MTSGNGPSSTVDKSFEMTDYGFRWNGMEVTRLFEREDGYTVVRVAGRGGAHVDIYVSPKGHAVKAYPSAKAKVGGRS